MRLKSLISRALLRVIVDFTSVFRFAFFREIWTLLVLFNALFFGCATVTLLGAGLILQPPPLYTGYSANVPEFLLGSGWLIMVLGIFVFNLVVSSFIYVTLPGLLLFPLSAIFLVYRGFLWGLLLYVLPVSVFLLALPTIVLEGEAYVFATVGGTLLGASWTRLLREYKGEGLSRVDALKMALKECLRIYVFVVIFLIAAAIAETIVVLLSI